MQAKIGGSFCHNIPHAMDVRGEYNSIGSMQRTDSNKTFSIERSTVVYRPIATLVDTTKAHHTAM